MRGGRFALVLTLLTAACTAAPTPTAAPAGTPSPTVSPGPTPTQRPTPAPTVLAFPASSQQELEPGLYDSSPPFAVDFTFRIRDVGWESAHIHQEFFDVMRFDGSSPTIPTRWVAWGYPQTIYGADGAQPVEGLSPAEAIDLMSSVPNVTASGVRPFTFAGRDGIAVDVATEVEGTHIFGGDAGDFGLDPAFPARLGAVPHDSGLLIVMCFGAPDIDQGCADAQPIIDSVELR